MEQTIKLICTEDGKTTEGFAVRRDFSVQERVLRAGKVFGILFAIGIGTVVVPLLHFILPPLFLLTACVFGTTTWLETSEVLEGEIACPNCTTLMNIPREAEEWPLKRRCAGCSYLLTVKPV